MMGRDGSPGQPGTPGSKVNKMKLIRYNTVKNYHLCGSVKLLIILILF